MDGERRCGEGNSALKQKDSLAYLEMLQELGDAKDDRVKKLKRQLKDRTESAKGRRRRKALFETWRRSMRR